MRSSLRLGRAQGMAEEGLILREGVTPGEVRKVSVEVSFM